MNMLLIVRYKNRKLYCKTHKKYVTLNWIASVLREGYYITVMDHVTKNTITGDVLAQLAPHSKVFKQQLNSEPFVDHNIFTRALELQLQ